MIVPLRSRRATAMVRASRMLWAEGIEVARSECRFGCIALMVRASEPLDRGSGEILPAWDQRTRIPAVQDQPDAIGRARCVLSGQPVLCKGPKGSGAGRHQTRSLI